MHCLKDPTPEQLIDYDRAQLAPYARKHKWGIAPLGFEGAESMIRCATPGLYLQPLGAWHASVANAYGRAMPEAVLQVYAILKTRRHLYISTYTTIEQVRGRSGIRRAALREAENWAARRIHRYLDRDSSMARRRRAERVATARAWYWEHYASIEGRQRRALKAMLLAAKNGEDLVVDVTMRTDSRGLLLRIERTTTTRVFVIVRDASNRDRMHALQVNPDFVPPPYQTPTAALGWTMNLTENEYAQLNPVNEA